MPRSEGQHLKWVPLLLEFICVATAAYASGPRWVTGPPYFTMSSQPVVWYKPDVSYYTDPGDLSSAVDHAEADAIVSAAAGVWNIPTANITLSQGGQLAEHVSSANVYPGANGLVFPADVSSSNYATIPIAVIYDTDGSVTDLLLGQGASDPVECRQNGVIESVDSITPQGAIQHALLILNGRCAGAAAEQQLQLQYQLMRAFGRVLGLAWSQTNDNVFTRTPVPTADEVQKWPIMHPIDVVCGPYTYQCQPSPFTLRPDDVASLSALYFMPQGTAPSGKSDTLSDASSITGRMQFGDGQGMQGINLLVRRSDIQTPFVESGAVTSAVSGNLYRWNNGNPVTGSPANTVPASMGGLNPPFEGAFSLIAIPLLANTSAQDTFMTSEPINPLYTGQYGLGPYISAPVTPSGPAFPWRDNHVVPYEQNYYEWNVPGSEATCDATALGSAASPTPVTATGWWANVLCGYGATSWTLLNAKADRNLSVEVTALDESGFVTENKLQPLIGAWNQPDPGNSLPTVAQAASPFNSIAAGLTLLNFDTPAGGGNLRIAITDQRGDGRPDYHFRARVLYADSLSPAITTAGGGLVILTGIGLRAGLTVTVGGAPAQVIGATATTLLAIAPPFAALGSGAALTADVTVLDPVSRGSTTLYGALTYPATSVLPQTPALTMLTPAFYVAAGQTVSLSPVASLSQSGAAAPGIAVNWSSSVAALTYPGGTQSISDSHGLATTAASASLSSGAAATGSACATIGASANLCGSFTAVGVDPSLWTVQAIEGVTQTVSADGILQPVVFQVTNGSGDPVIGAPVTVFQTVSGYQVCPATGRCPVAPVYSTSQATAISHASGLVVATVQQITGSPQTTTIAVSTGTQGFVSVALQKTP